jgi:hypothetical protein
MNSNAQQAGQPGAAGAPKEVSRPDLFRTAMGHSANCQSLGLPRQGYDTSSHTRRLEAMRISQRYHGY